jgi:hypothetical protein
LGDFWHFAELTRLSVWRVETVFLSACTVQAGWREVKTHQRLHIPLPQSGHKDIEVCRNDFQQNNLILFKKPILFYDVNQPEVYPPWAGG